MSHDHKLEVLSGRLQQLLFSPKGSIEGLLLTVKSKTVQVSMKQDDAHPTALHQALGKPIELKALRDHSPKTKHGAHPVYKLRAITKLAGAAAPGGDGAPAVHGVVAAIHYSRHGHPNGVILESGEFIHTRPPGMKKLKLKVGSKVTAHGELRMTMLGTSLLEALEVNRVTIE
jgi:hypothetical protein